MNRSMCARVLLGSLILGGLVLTGCKKEEEPATVPVPTASQAAAPTPDPAPTPSASASADDAGAPEAPSAGQAAAPAAPGTGTATARKGESIDACCAALKAVQKSGKTAIAKSKAASAAAVCPGVAKLVKDGTTSRSAGLAQIRSALSGFDVPGECR